LFLFHAQPSSRVAVASYFNCRTDCEPSDSRLMRTEASAPKGRVCDDIRYAPASSGKGSQVAGNLADAPLAKAVSPGLILDLNAATGTGAHEAVLSLAIGH